MQTGHEPRDGRIPVDGRCLSRKDFLKTDGVFLRGDSVFERCWPYVYSLLGDPTTSKFNLEQVGVAQLPVGKEDQQSCSTLEG